MERAPPDGLVNASGALAGEAAAAAGGARSFSAAWTAVLAALMALLIVATVLGNALVMLAFVADSSLRTQNNFFLLNLAISDFLVGKAPRPRPLPEPGGAEPTGPSELGGPGSWGSTQTSGARAGEGASEPSGQWARAKLPASQARQGLRRDLPRKGLEPAGARRSARRSGRGCSAGFCAVAKQRLRWAQDMRRVLRGG